MISNRDPSYQSFRQYAGPYSGRTDCTPIYEEKVVDFILELANGSEKTVSVEDLFKDDDEAVSEKAEAKSAKTKDL